MKKTMKLLSMAIALALIFSVCSSASAAQELSHSNQVVFSELDQLAAGESKEYTVVDSSGGKAIVGIRKMPAYARTDSERWQVWYRGINSYVEFYMTVSNNRVTSVSDYSISLTGGSYDNANLSKTSTYGKLTFTYKSVAGIVTKTCWLKGTVTGSDNKITVDWDM